MQIRPIVDRKEMLDEKIMETSDSELILKTHSALGHGTMDNVKDIVYIKPECFSMFNNPMIAREIEKNKPSVRIQRRRIYTNRSWQMGFKRPCSWHTCQMASYISDKAYSRSIVAE